jgi:hypothetical protein
MRDSNAVVGEGRVHAGNFGGWHVAGDARGCADGTGFSRMVARGSATTSNVARQTLGVVERGNAHNGFVRIVTGDAPEAGISFTPAAAAFQAIGLKSHIAHTGCAGV